jgi:hypothetical protein
VISLALILQNPAPVLPETGSAISSLATARVNGVAATEIGWDKDLYARTSVSNRKRGRILSRGTLVVVSYSDPTVLISRIFFLFLTSLLFCDCLHPS